MSSVRITKKADNWELPGEGQHVAVLTGVADLGITKTKWGDKDRAELQFALEQTGSDGQPLTVKVRVTKSLFKKASLSMFVEALVGCPTSEIPLGSTVELADLVGRSCLLIIQHHTSTDGRQWANVISALRLPAGTSPIPLPAVQPGAVQAPTQPTQPINRWPAAQPATQPAASSSQTWQPPSTPPPPTNPAFVIGTTNGRS